MIKLFNGSKQYLPKYLKNQESFTENNVFVTPSKIEFSSKLDGIFIVILDSGCAVIFEEVVFAKSVELIIRCKRI